MVRPLGAACRTVCTREEVQQDPACIASSVHAARVEGMRATDAALSAREALLLVQASMANCDTEAAVV
jgi:hypothetical protein